MPMLPASSVGNVRRSVPRALGYEGPGKMGEGHLSALKATVFPWGDGGRADETLRAFLSGDDDEPSFTARSAANCFCWLLSCRTS